MHFLKGAVDLAFMLDTSSSIGGEANFQLCIKFIKSVYASFTISSTAYRIGLVLFGASASVSFDFSKYSSASELDSAIGSMKLVGGACAAGQALSTCQSQLFAQSRKEASKILLVMMAGKSTDDVSGVAGALKSSDVNIFCLGMGSSIDKTQLTAMASSETYVQVAADFSQLASMSSQFVSLFGQVSGGKYKQFIRKTTFIILWGGRSSCKKEEIMRFDLKLQFWYWY